MGADQTDLFRSAGARCRRAGAISRGSLCRRPIAAARSRIAAGATSAAENFIESPALDVAARELAREQSGEPEADLTGRTLTHYRILDKIGAGGMGVVYRAEDLRLGRVVALKVLSGELTGDKLALQRFQREARAISALNHPHICTLHDVGEHEGWAFLVMEHLAGETLAGRLAKGPLEVDEAVEICRQIAEGLEAAHEQGIIHRDLKPANVKITPGGKVKILDFGLARILRDQAGDRRLVAPADNHESRRPVRGRCWARQPT